MNSDLTLVVMAAGMGSRFGGLKQMEPVGRNGEAILDFSVYDAIEAGFNKVVFVIKHQIADDFKRIVGSRIEKKIKVEYVYQETDKLPGGFFPPETRKKPWGTGHAILCCRDVINEPFAVINADDYYGKSCFKVIADFLRRGGEDYCMAGFLLKNTLSPNGTVTRGVCSVAADGYLKSVRETQNIDSSCRFTDEDGKVIAIDPDNPVSMNMWGIFPDIFDRLEEGFKEFLSANSDSEKAEFYLPVLISDLINRGIKKVKVLPATDRWYGVTYPEDKQSVVDALGKLIDDGSYDNM